MSAPVTRAGEDAHAAATRGRPRRPAPRVDARGVRDTRIGLALGGAIVVGWLALQAATLTAWPRGAWSPALAVAAIPVVLLQTWLGAGLFIVAHDAMHGSLSPSRPGAGRLLARIALALYAGFSFDRLLPAHHDHHRTPGTGSDPDFAADHPTRFWPWYAGFLRRYFGLRQFATLAATFVVLAGPFAVPVGHLLIFWALPAILSSLQLFRWGTYLPHRHEHAAFADRHRARSDTRGAWVTLATCFHFGLHHEHHLRPDVPWWRLPSVRRQR